MVLTQFSGHLHRRQANSATPTNRLSFHIMLQSFATIGNQSVKTGPCKNQRINKLMEGGLANVVLTLHGTCFDHDLFPFKRRME